MVPTLVDNLKRVVVVDSKNIMEYLDRELPEPSLYPAHLQETVTRQVCSLVSILQWRGQTNLQVSLVDATPHAALLYCGDPHRDTRPAFIRGLSRGLPAKQVTI